MERKEDGGSVVLCKLFEMSVWRFLYIADIYLSRTYVYVACVYHTV